MRKPTNTTQAQREHLELAAATGMPVGAFIAESAILAQEARGQQEMVASTVIPTEILYCTAEDFEALGFKLGDVHADDPMFREAQLPAGWKREGSDHSMWSYIVDERGFRRCSIFYKAAFYDRSAHISIDAHPTTRAQDDTYAAFDQWCPYEEGWKTETRKDGDNLVRVARLCETDETGRKVYDYAAGDWKFTGRVRERVIAPDGFTVSERDSREST